MTYIQGFGAQYKNVVVYSVMISLIMFNIPFNNISAISWQSVFLVEETGVPRGN